MKEEKDTCHGSTETIGFNIKITQEIVGYQVVELEEGVLGYILCNAGYDEIVFIVHTDYFPNDIGG